MGTTHEVTNPIVYIGEDLKVSTIVPLSGRTYRYDEATDSVVATTYDGQAGFATSIVNASSLKSRGYSAETGRYSSVSREQLQYYFT